MKDQWRGPIGEQQRVHSAWTGTRHRQQLIRNECRGREQQLLLAPAGCGNAVLMGGKADLTFRWHEIKNISALLKKLAPVFFLFCASAYAQTLSSVQTAFWGDSSCDSGSTGQCTVSTSAGVTKMRQNFTPGSVVVLFTMIEGTKTWPLVNSITCLGTSSSCGPWQHISGGNVVSCGSGSTNCGAVTNGNSCQGQILDSTGHHFAGDCYYFQITGPGVSGITVTITDPNGNSDITNSGGFIHEWACSPSPCPSPIIDAQATRIYPGNGAAAGCASCTGPALTLTGNNDVIEQLSIFEEKCGSTCTPSPYTLESWDAVAQNATGYLYGTGLSGGAAIWPQTPKGGGVFSAFALTFATDPAPEGLQFIPVTPCRIADTRNPTGPFGGPEMSAGSTRTFDITQSACNIPSTAVAYSLNVSVVPSGPLGHLTLWPTGETQPLVSTLNSDGRIKGNAAIVPAGISGGVNVFVTNTTHVILDIDGYFAPAGTTSALSFYPVPPCRVADTRNPTGPLGGPMISGGTSRAFPVQSSSCGIPSTAQAYSLNVSAVPHGTLGHLTTWPTGESQPLVSTLNSPTGEVVANAAIVPAGRSGEISIFVTNNADVILDIDGYFAPPETGGLLFYTVTPCRVLDTRSSAGAFSGFLTVNVDGSTCAPPSTAQAHVYNVTVVPSGPLGHLTLWPNGEAKPDVSTLNASDGAITSNMAIVPTTNGSINAFATNPTNLIFDIFGYFAP